MVDQQPTDSNGPTQEEAGSGATGQQQGSTNRTKEQLIRDFKAQYFSIDHPTPFRLEVIACLGNQSESNQNPDGLSKIFEEYGFGGISVDDYKAIIQYKDPGTVDIPSTPPTTTPISEKNATYSISSSSGVFRVTSPDPPSYKMFVKEVSDGKPSEIAFEDKDATFTSKLERDATGDHWATWTDHSDSTSYKVKFWSEWNEKDGGITKSFDGYSTKAGVTSPFKGNLITEQSDLPQEQSWWDKWGKYCAGVSLVWAIGTYIYGRLRDNPRAQAAYQQGRLKQMEDKAREEAKAAQEMLDRAPPARRQALVDSIKEGLADTFGRFTETRAAQNLASLKDGTFVYDFENSNKRLLEGFKTTIEAKIRTWIAANPDFPQSTILKEMVASGKFPKEELQARQQRIMEEAVHTIASNMNAPDGKYNEFAVGLMNQVRLDYNTRIIEAGLLENKVPLSKMPELNRKEADTMAAQQVQRDIVRDNPNDAAKKDAANAEIRKLEGEIQDIKQDITAQEGKKRKYDDFLKKSTTTSNERSKVDAKVKSKTSTFMETFMKHGV